MDHYLSIQHPRIVPQVFHPQIRGHNLAANIQIHEAIGLPLHT